MTTKKKMKKIESENKQILNQVKKVSKKFSRLNIRRKPKKKNKLLFKKVIRTMGDIQGGVKANSTYKQCLMDPKLYLARVPQSTSKTIIVKLVRNFTVTANSAGNAAFVFLPQAINDIDRNGAGHSPFLWQNAAAYTPNAAETTIGYTAIDVGSIINSAFCGARAVSARIELMPNVSLTTAVGRGIIAMTKIKTSASKQFNPGTTSQTEYGNLQLQSTILASPNASVCEVSKMQGLSANWIPHESIDLLDFPVINFNSLGSLATAHPSENIVFGLFTSLPANCTINVRTYTNVELLPDSTQAGSGLFPLVAEYTYEKSHPIQVLRDVYVNTRNFTHILTMNNTDSQ